MSRFMNSGYKMLEAYTPGEQPKDMQYIKLNTNESPYPPAPQVVEALDAEQIRLLRLYSDPTGNALKRKLAKLYGLNADNIFISNGSDDILNFAFMAFGENGAVFPDITYGFYSVFGQLNHVDCTLVPLTQELTVNHSDYLNRGKMIVLANPNAPTGISLNIECIREILKTNPDNAVVIDEAYVDFGGESCVKLIPEFDNLLVVRTFSKSRCMAGARLGYAMGNSSLIADLEKIKYSTNPYNVNRLTMRLGEVTVDAEDYYQDKCREIIKTRQMTKEALESLGFTVLPSDANFLFAKSRDIPGEALYQALKKKGILVRHFAKDRICDYVRITIGTNEQMNTLVHTIKAILQEAYHESQ